MLVQNRLKYFCLCALSEVIGVRIGCSKQCLKVSVIWLYVCEALPKCSALAKNNNENMFVQRFSFVIEFRQSAVTLRIYLNRTCKKALNTC